MFIGRDVQNASCAVIQAISKQSGELNGSQSDDSHHAADTAICAITSLGKTSPAAD